MKTNKDSLGDRMKMYEGVSKSVLMKKTPVIIRLDGKAFHTFTKYFERPFDLIFANVMQETTKYLCENIQGCVLGYTQSDEITLVLTDYETYDTCAWFDYEVQKLCSVASSMCTMYFNKRFNEIVNNQNSHLKYKTYADALKNGAMFDCRCFNVPLHEVSNVILWRQQDATRNSIQMLGQHYFTHEELQNKNCDEIQEMLFSVYGVNWNNIPTMFKRGSSVIKNDDNKWFIDFEMPIITQDRNYIDSRIIFDE